MSEYTIDWKPRRTCCVYDATEPSGHCEKPWFARGRCREHWVALRNMSLDEQAQEIERAGMPVRTKWTYENPEGEAELAETYGELKSETTGE
jgi:hypothetical protein